jgi:hypothetical protein
VARDEPDGGWPTFRVNLFADLTRTAGDLFTRSLVALFQGIADAARRIVEGVMGSSINFITQTPPSVSYDSPTVRGLWATVRGIANAGLALVALWGGFNLMAREHLGAPYHAAMELFPRIVIAALLVNTSLWWAQLAIDANNALCLAFGQVSLPAWENAASGAQAFANVLVAVVYLVTARDCQLNPVDGDERAGEGMMDGSSPGQAAAGSPVTSRHVAKRACIVWRYSGAGRWCRRGRKWSEMGPNGLRNCCACSGDLNRCSARSRRRVGRCEFSARLLSPLCRRCTTPGSTRRTAGG